MRSSLRCKRVEYRTHESPPAPRSSLSCSALPLGAFAQSRKIPVIAYMSPVVPQNNTDWRLDAFLQGMRDLGYVDGKSMKLVVRWGEGRLERMPAIARELVNMKLDVIVACLIALGARRA